MIPKNGRFCGTLSKFPLIAGLVTWRAGGWVVKAMALASCVLITGCSGGEPTEEVSPKVVKLIVVGEQDGIKSRRFVGRVLALRKVDLSFQVSGRLVEFPAVQGRIIREGELIAQLAQTDYELAVKRALAERELLMRDMQRKRKLLERNAISQSVFDEAQTNLELSEVRLEQARQNLSYTTIRAPFDALVTRRLVDLHSNVQPNEQIIRVQDVSELRIRISVPEALIRHVLNPDRLIVSAEMLAMRGQRIPLEYREHVTEPDEVAQTYEVEFALGDDVPFVVLPGMTAAVSISLDDPTAASEIEIPVSALDQDATGNFQVWRYDPENQSVSPRSVIIGDIRGDQVAVVSGLGVGETIAATGSSKLRDGMQVRPLKRAH